MLNEKLIKNKIKLITEDLERLKTFQGMTFDEVAKDFIKYDAVQNILMKIIGRAIDINEHIIAKNLPLAERMELKYRDTFLKVGELEILPKDFAKKISDSAGLRNALVHNYDQLDDYLVYDSIDDALDQYSEYCDYIMKYIEKD